MRILVYPHDLDMGGSQLNAIDLAAAVARRGHHVVVFGEPGVLVERITQLGLPFEPSPTPGRRPSPAAVKALGDVVRRQDIDLLHGYEWPPALETALVASRLRKRSLTTVLSMSVAGFLPRSVPLIVGTRQIADVERRRGRADVSVLEPPVDLEFDNVETFTPASIGDSEALRIVVVNRLVPELKLEGLLTAIEVVGSIAESRRVQLIIVGDGPARGEVEQRAQEVNTARGNRVVVVAGQMADPRPAYASADIVLGMGGSALRGMAFGKPIVVQGERGFWKLLDSESVELFRYQGWYGVGGGTRHGAAALRSALQPLLDDESARRRHGSFANDIVRRHFSLEHSADTLIGHYEFALRTRTTGRTMDLGRTAALDGRYFVKQRIERLRGSGALDDFNSNPAAHAESVPVSL